jgi:Na+/melibiose symporter-like transporter
MTDLIRSMALGALRTFLAGLVPTLIAAGVLQQNQANDFIGAGCFLGAVGFSVLDKLLWHRRVAVALATPVPPAAPASMAPIPNP